MLNIGIFLRLTQIFKILILNLIDANNSLSKFWEKRAKNRKVYCQIQNSKYLMSEFSAILSIKIEPFIDLVIPNWNAVNVYREFLAFIFSLSNISDAHKKKLEIESLDLKSKFEKLFGSEIKLKIDYIVFIFLNFYKKREEHIF